MSDKKNNPNRREDTLIKERTTNKKPSQYKVILHNDDYTTMEFVIEVLVHFFRKDLTEATALMLQIHHKGSAVGGIYSLDVAETKADQVISYARQQGHPFMLTVEPA